MMSLIRTMSSVVHYGMTYENISGLRQFLYCFCSFCFIFMQMICVMKKENIRFLLPVILLVGLLVKVNY